VQRINSLDVEFNDDVVKKLSVIETIQIFIGDSDSSQCWWWWICEQPAGTHTHTHTCASTQCYERQSTMAFISITLLCWIKCSGIP